MLDATAIQRILDRLAQLPSHDPAHPDVRLIAQTRARDACEYCLMPTRTLFHVDHIVPVVRWQAYLAGALLLVPLISDRDANHLDNFAWSCPYCNQAKGNRDSGRVGNRATRLFHPRRDRWDEHFLLTDGFLFISGVSEIGRATERTLGFNSARRNGPLAARHKAIVDGVYPPIWARGWLT
jgi:hypothetical protein